MAGDDLSREEQLLLRRLELLPEQLQCIVQRRVRRSVLAASRLQRHLQVFAVGLRLQVCRARLHPEQAACRLGGGAAASELDLQGLELGGEQVLDDDRLHEGSSGGDGGAWRAGG